MQLAPGGAGWNCSSPIAVELGLWRPEWPKSRLPACKGFCAEAPGRSGFKQESRPGAPGSAGNGGCQALQFEDGNECGRPIARFQRRRRGLTCIQPPLPTTRGTSIGTGKLGVPRGGSYPVQRNCRRILCVSQLRTATGRWCRSPDCRPKGGGFVAQQGAACWRYRTCLQCNCSCGWTASG